MSEPFDGPGLKIRTCADQRAVQMAGKLAAGTAEAFDLAPGATRRLTTVLVEATRNVVDHAYAGVEPGDIVIDLSRREGASPDGRDEIEVAITDFGNGWPFTPSSSDPPGLGLSVMSELTEGLSISTRKHRGTTVGATIRVPGNDDESEERLPASHGSRLDFADPVFLMPVVPRAVAVHVAAMNAGVDSLRTAITGGRDIVDCIDHGAIAAHGGTLSLDTTDGSADLDVRMGPMPVRAAEPLLDRLEGRLDRAHHASMESTAGGETSVLVTMAMV